MPVPKPGFELYERQNKAEKPVIFSVEAVFFSVLLTAWILFALLLCLQGFGSDTDAWLMAQTAARLAAGEGYDPARSLGNPLWEFLLPLLQRDYDFRISNGFNLLLSLLFMFGLRFINGEENKQKLVLLLCLMPVFTEAASSSMELMSAWCLLLGCLLAIQAKREKMLMILSLLAGLSRPEFFLLVLAAWNQRRTFLPWLVFPALLLAGYLFWALGKNPAPFSTLSEAAVFYAGRVWFLMRQAGLLLPFYLYLLFLSLQQQHPALKSAGLASLALFFIFPFEWAYAFPALLSGAARLSNLKIDNFRLQVLVPLAAISLGSSFLLPGSGLLGLYQQRKLMLQQYKMASSFLPEKPSLLTEGATFLPTRFQDWERSHQNRLFHKKGSLLWVGERLSKAELDSFQKEGFWIGRFSDYPVQARIMQSDK